MTDRRRPARRWLRRLAWTLATVLGLALVAVAGLAWYESQASPFQSRYLVELGQQMTWTVGPGPSDSLRFPASGPFDRRLGYSELPSLADRLVGRGFVIERQARISPAMAAVADRGLYLPFREKTRAGLVLQDCAARPIFAVRYPERTYPGFAAIPPLVTATLLYIENRELLDNRYVTSNPAIEWGRMAQAGYEQLRKQLEPARQASGGSTLATQIEKYRHSAGGRTNSGEDKLVQIASASLRAYLDGPDTTAARRQLVVDYLNTVPLSARRGYGEVLGLGDGLWAWFGRDFAEVNALLEDAAAPAAARALAYKQVLALMIAQRRPSGYLGGDLPALQELTDTYLRLLARDGIIDAALRDAALPLALEELDAVPRVAPASFVARKAANTGRRALASALGLPRLYTLDRLDLTATTTLDLAVQERVAATLGSLATAAGAAAAGLRGERLLGNEDPAGVVYSVTLYERTPAANVVRLQVDNYDKPLDINEGTRLDLGSTAKLRTLVTYLESVAALHARLAPLDEGTLRATPVASGDPISRWAVDHLLAPPGGDRSLAAMLDAALERRYSGSPAEVFFTGGGQQTFSNFDPADDARVMSVREAFERSVNLVFVRLMRDVVRYTIFSMPDSSATLLDDPGDERRREFLARFADREGREYLGRFYRKYAGLAPAAADTLLLQGIRPTPRRLAAIHPVLAPDADADRLAAFIRANLPDARIDDASIARLHRDYGTGRIGLADRGYVAGIHPLELWLVGYLRGNSGASLAEAVAASVDERQQAYAWLFRTRSRAAQDRRIRTLVELQAYMEIHRGWQRLGYPFGYLTPSYGTALGSSADRPAALAELVGILLNDGLRLPTLRIDSLHFAADTPYETRFVASPASGERVLPAEVAAAARGMLASVVERGTGQRLRGVFTDADGRPLTTGGKTGTGDHRFQTYGRGGELLSSRVVSRSGTFVFYIGDRFFGVVTAYVTGPAAAGYSFTSALPAQLLKTLAPDLGDLVRRPAAPGFGCVVTAATPADPAALPAMATPAAGPIQRAAPPAPATEPLDTAPALEPADAREEAGTGQP
ncbi:MAG: penicillin-binding protein [Chromatiales bacterium]|nr:penicillin-binding protein [Chromatiales bacterium]